MPMSEHACDLCESTFDSQRGLSNHKTQGHNEPWHDKETLEKMYVEKGMSQEEIADELGCSSFAIYRWMDKHGIEADTARWHPAHPPNHNFFQGNDNIGSQYEQSQTMIDGERYTVPIHRLIAVAYGKLSGDDFFNPDIVVHHKSGHGLDNRPENLEAMGKGDHQRLHMGID